MSISDLEIKWLKFVRRLRVVGVLLIFVIIPYVAIVIIPIYFIMTMVAVGDINKLNHELKDPYLKSFRSKYVTASIFKLIGSILVHVGAAMMVIINSGFSLLYFYSYYGLFSPSFIIFVIGFIIMIIGSGVEIGAWDNLKLFIYHNKDMFPGRNNYDMTSKVENLRSGAVAWALGFLGITIIIGWISQLVGYFGLSSVAERGSKIDPIAPKIQDYQTLYPPPLEPQPVENIVFCPMCGSKVSKGATFCSECGVKLII